VLTTLRSQMRQRLAASEVAVRDPARRPGAQFTLGVLPFLVMGAVAAADVLVGPRFGFLPLLSLGPAMAAVSLRPLQTALVGGLAVAGCVPLAAYDYGGQLWSRRVLIALATIAGVTVAGAVASAARHRRERELANVRIVAEAAQRVLLRPVPSEIGPLQVAVRYISASAAARIGGDLYEVVTAGESVRLIVADVQGKGLAAVQTAAVVLGAFREAAYEAQGLAEIAAQIELSLERQAAADEFVTAVLAEVKGGGPAIEILNCGHPPPLLLSGGALRYIEPAEPGLPLGLAELLAVGPRMTSTVVLGPDERLLFYTDGISEARDKSGNFYPLDRCGDLVCDLGQDAALDRLRDDVIRHVGHQLRDDAAMLLVARGQGDQSPPGSPRPAAGLAG
jgi:serine phosphatase RsbU (regulator of sigma subunit)